jgi:Rad3-related DNA helicase
MSNQPKEHEDDFDDDFDTDVEENLDLEDFDIEIEDDTPEEDRGRPRRAEGEEPDIPDDEELKQYSKNAGKRISKLKAEYHEERRQKEESTRLREEAIDYARKIKEENDRLRKNLEEGEGVLMGQAKGSHLSRIKQG